MQTIGITGESSCLSLLRIFAVLTIGFWLANASSSWFESDNSNIVESNLSALLTPAEWRSLIGPYSLPGKSISLAAVDVRDDDRYDKLVIINATNFGKHIRLQLKRNIKLVDSNLLVLVRTDNSTIPIPKQVSELQCFYRSSPHPGSSSYFAAIDLCDGVRGIVISNATTEYYTINPLPKRLRSADSNTTRPSHILVKLNPADYQHAATDDDVVDGGPLSFNQNYNFKKRRRRKRNVAAFGGDHRSTDYYWKRIFQNAVTPRSTTGYDDRGRSYQCGNTYIDRISVINDDSPPKLRGRYARATVVSNQSTVIYIETAVFIDKDLFDNMKTNFPVDTEAELIRFVLALINAVELLYHDPSLGLTVNFVLKRLEILHADPIRLVRSHDIDRFLSNFCTWQHSENPVGDDNPLHWDHAVILTGLDLYVLSKNGKITNQVVGLAPVAGMCTATSSCTVNEGRHFESAYVVAHEIGHNLGMRHDGASADNNCDPSSYLMSPTLGSGKITWSTCSRRYLERFLESKQSRCLMDRGITSDLLDHRAEGVLPGERFDANRQCKLKYGNSSIHSVSQSLEDVCKDLHCSRDRYTWTSHPALEGTVCGLNKWCRSGRCVEKGLSALQAGYAPNLTVNGGWSKWTAFSDCASSCLYGNSNGLLSGSTGIMIAARRCNNPRPENGGELCSGGDQKYRTCTAPQCNTVKKLTLADFANELCSKASEMDSELAGIGNHRISTDPVEACAVWCYKKNGGYKSRGSYPDGTACQMKRYRRSTYCIKGTCREFLCGRHSDNVIYSHSEEFCHHQQSPPRLVSSSITSSTPSSTSSAVTSAATIKRNTTTSTTITTTTTGKPTEVEISIGRDKRKEFVSSGEWTSSSNCFYNCIVPGTGMKLVDKKLCPSCNITVNVQSCQPLKQVCVRIKSVLEHATVVCNKYSQRVRRLSGIGMQLSQTNDDPHRPCRLACQDESVSHRFYLVNGEDGWFPFGTDCTRGDTTRKAYCINGKCLEFGRDNTPLYDFTYSLPLLDRIKRETAFNHSLPSVFDPSISNTLQDIIHYLKYGQYLNMKKAESKFNLDFTHPVHVNKEDLQF